MQAMSEVDRRTSAQRTDDERAATAFVATTSLERNAPSKTIRDCTPVLRSDPEPETIEPRQFRLGMPHLGTEGVRRSWLLREAGHLHWWAISRQLGTSPGELRDRTGARAMASVVACGIHGQTEHFHEDDDVRLELVQAPFAANGWLSRTRLAGTNGALLTVEIVTAFARRNGNSNRDLEIADMPTEFAPARAGKEARRAAMFRRLGASARWTAEGDKAPAHMTFPIKRSLHLNGVGLVYFAVLHDFIVESEANALPALVAALPIVDRRLHFFGNLDSGDRLDVLCRSSVWCTAPKPSVIVTSYGRRGSDGKVVVCAETHFRL